MTFSPDTKNNYINVKFMYMFILWMKIWKESFDPLWYQIFISGSIIFEIEKVCNIFFSFRFYYIRFWMMNDLFFVSIIVKKKLHPNHILDGLPFDYLETKTWNKFFLLKSRHGLF